MKNVLSRRACRGAIYVEAHPKHDISLAEILFSEKNKQIMKRPLTDLSKQPIMFV